MKFNYLFVALGLLLFSCSSDDDTTPLLTESDNLILISNEGAFFGNSASLTLVNREESIATQNIYYDANEEAELGDVAQSMYEYNDEIYVVVNNSGKIEVIDADNFTAKRTISGLASPRYMLFESADKAYVSDYSAKGIHVVNPTNGTYQTFINGGFWVEHMIAFNNQIWCSAPDKDKVFFLDPLSQTFTDSLTLSHGVSDMGIDANNDFWIMSQGSYNEPIIEPALHHIDGNTKEIIATYSFPSGTGFGGNLTMSGDKQSVLYLMGGKIYKLVITDATLPTIPFIEKSVGGFYTLTVNKENGEIAATDAFDFSQAGRVYFYAATGNAIDNYATGIAPRSVVWLED